MEINIKSRSCTSLISFDEFKLVSDELYPQIILSCDIRFKAKGFTVLDNADFELSDFEDMLTNLEFLYKDLKRIFFFGHSENRVEIKFEPDDNGIIKLIGFIRSSDYKNRITFNFETDQSFLPDLIKECQLLINQVKAGLLKG